MFTVFTVNVYFWLSIINCWSDWNVTKTTKLLVTKYT